MAVTALGSSNPSKAIGQGSEQSLCTRTLMVLACSNPVQYCVRVAICPWMSSRMLDWISSKKCVIFSFHHLKCHHIPRTGGAWEAWEQEPTTKSKQKVYIIYLYIYIWSNNILFAYTVKRPAKWNDLEWQACWATGKIATNVTAKFTTVAFLQMQCTTAAW